MQNTKRTHKLILDIGNSLVKYYLGLDLYSSVYNAKDLSEKIKQEQIGELDLYAISTVKGKISFVIKELQDLNPDIKINIKEILDEKVKREEFLIDVHTNFGIDRLTKLCGALILKPESNIILFDFGTASTMNVATPNQEPQSFGTFVSGLIAPGFTSSIRSLNHYCSALDDYSSSKLLKELKNKNPDLKDTKNTEAQIVYGCYRAHQGLISNWLEQAHISIKPSPYTITTSIATGGHAEIFREFFDEIIDSSLLLNTFFDKNTESKNHHAYKSHQAQ